MKLLHILLVVVVLSQGCALQNEEAMARRNRQQITRLSIGMSTAQVVATVGRPYKAEAYEVGEDTYSVLYYQTRLILGATADRETTPILLKNDAVIGWGG